MEYTEDCPGEKDSNFDIVNFSLPRRMPNDSGQDSFLWKEIQTTATEEIDNILTSFFAWIGLLDNEDRSYFNIVCFDDELLFTLRIIFSPEFSFQELNKQTEESRNNFLDNKQINNNIEFNNFLSNQSPAFLIKTKNLQAADLLIRSINGSIGIVIIQSLDIKEVFFVVKTDLSENNEFAYKITESFFFFCNQVLLFPQSPLRSLRLIEQFEPIISGPKNRVKYSTFIEWFKSVLIKYSNNLAVSYLDKNYSYHEIDTLSDYIAAFMQSRKITKSSRVGVFLKRSHWIPISILGILKLGATYVPLSMTDPIDRIRFFIKDADINLIIASEESNFLSTLLPEIEILYVNENLSQLNSEKENFPELNEFDESDTAYIIYTSGTTGKPKGVSISNGALVNFLSWQSSIFNVNTEDRFLQSAPITFDFSIGELFIPLINGATLVVVPDEISHDPLSLSRYIYQAKITVAHFVPTVLHYLIEVMSKSDENSYEAISKSYLKHIICNGEPLSDTLRRKLISVLPNVSLHNCYGPTEATVAVTHYLCPMDKDERAMYIGQPGSNIDLYILNRQGQLLPKGLIGELYIGGTQLATEYINNHELTANKFVLIGVGDSTTRLYKTGDLVRSGWHENIEFIGRNDQQVKIRGMRVELGEIENTILNDLSVEQCAVLFEKNYNKSHQQLIAFITPETIKIQELIERLHKHIPEYMMPNQFIPLKTLPIASNGKLDRKTLLRIASEAKSITPSKSLSSPAQDVTAEELLLTNIVEDILRISVDRNANLTYLGLDSLAFLEMQLLVNEHGYILPIDLFRQNSTIASLAPKLPKVKLSSNNKEILSKSFIFELDTAFKWALENDPEVVVLHSSLVHLQYFDTNILKEIILEIIKNGVNRGITFAFPAFNFKFCWTKKFHFKETQSETGIVSTWVQDMAGSLRTPHPFYSFVSIGPLAKSLANCKNTTPFGDDSYFGWFENKNARIITIGTKAITQYHRCEQLANVPYHKYEYITGEVNYGAGWISSGGIIYVRDLETFPQKDLFAGNVEKTCETLGSAFRSHSLGSTQIHYVTCNEMRAKIVPVLMNDPFALLVHESEVRNKYLEGKLPL